MLQTRLNCSRRGAHGQRGFTLIELMISLLIMGLIMSVVYKVFSSQDRFFRNQEQIASMQENLRATMEYINQELSWLGYQVPGIAVIKAGPSDIIFKANIPNSGSTIQYVRYQFDPSTNTIRRAAGADESFVENADLTVMASDIEAMAISYYNILNGLVITTTADPLCADELDAAVCAPGDPDDDASLLMVQRVKARVTARTSKPDWMYTDPNGGPNPNFRKRRAVLDLRARNIEDVTLQGGQIVVGSCGYLTHSITVPTPYAACADREYDKTSGGPDPDFTDNPYVTIQAYDLDGNANTNPLMEISVSAVGDDGLIYDIYDDTVTINNRWELTQTGDPRYIAANLLSKVSAGTEVELRLAYSDGYCTQVTYEGNTPIIIAANPASVFNTSATMPDGLSVDYVDNSGSPITVLATPGKVAMCSSVGNERVILGAQLIDECGNGTPGETIAWSDGGFGGSFVSETDNGDGTYSATYVPPDSMGTVASTYTATLSAQWGAFTPNVDVDLIAAQAHDIVIDAITEVSASGLYQFVSNPQPDNNSTFDIERVDGQLVEVKFHLVDECGNRVYGQSSSMAGSSSLGALGTTFSEDGNGEITVTWSSAEGCGAEAPGHITLSSSAIANLGTATETINFDLLETTASGPRVVMSVSAPGTLIAGNTSDFVTITAEIQEYNEFLQLCNNVPGPFDVQYEVTGNGGRSGSFSGTEHEVTVYNTTSDAGGTATAELHPGTALWNDALTVTATADVEGASYDNNIGVLLKPSTPGSASGFYNSTALVVKGVGEADRSYDPGEFVYVILHDYDENESPIDQDSIGFTRVFVTLTSLRTGDTEKVELIEKDTNTALFLGNIETELNGTALADDSILQVLYGDLITMTYRDKNDLAEFESWEVFTSGPRSLELFKVVGAIETNIFTGATQTEEIYYEDDIRVKLYIPEFELDGSSGTTTDTIITGSGADEDLLALREFGDTGMLIPDSAVYGGATTFKVTKTDTGVQTNLLFISSTPRTVTVSYPDAVTPVETLSFTMFDQDVPTITIDSPTDGSSVTGTVIISVNAADISNTSASGGITLIELYVNGRLIDSVMGADLSGANAFTWTTAIGSTPYWLDGTHVLTARAFDTSNNEATSDPVSVTVANGQNPLWFNVPSYANSTWSDQVAVQMEVDINPAQSGTYQLILNVNDISAASFSVTGSGTFDHTVVTTALAEGKNTLVAILKNTWTGEYQTTALDFTMDRTPPVINIGTPPDWISIADFALPGMTVDVTVSDPIVAAGDPNDVDDASVKGSFAGVCSSGLIDMSELSAGSDTYSVLWAGPCADVEGSITLTVNASDVANPPNDAPPTSVTTSIDTKMPTIDAPTVSTVLGSLITGTVTIDTQVHDTYPQKVHLEIFDVAGGTFVVNNGGFTDTPLNNVDGSGNFTTTYDTTTVSDGPYIIRVGGWDQAGNEILDPTDYIYFVDNSKPVVDSPYVYNPNNIVDGTVNVRYYASDPFGLIKGVNVVIMADGENPSVDTPLSTETLAFPFDTRNTAVSGVASLDVSSLSNGPYDVYCRATDWAGNQSNWSGNHNMVLDRTYLTAMWGYYSVTGINNDVTVGGTLYDGAAPSVGSTIHLWGRVKPASGDTTWQSYNFYVQTDAAGAYSSTPINNIQAGDLFYVYHYSPWNEFIGYNFATVPGAVTTNYTSYLPRGVQVRQPFMRWTEYPGPDYAADVGGILWDNTGAVSGHNMRVRFNLYDSGGTTYTGFREYTASTAFDGSFSINTWPDLFPEGQRMYVYFYDDTIGGSSLGYFYGNAVPYIMPDPLRPDDF